MFSCEEEEEDEYEEEDEKRKLKKKIEEGEEEEQQEQEQEQEEDEISLSSESDSMTVQLNRKQNLTTYKTFGSIIHVSQLEFLLVLRLKKKNQVICTMAAALPGRWYSMNNKEKTDIGTMQCKVNGSGQAGPK